MNPRDDPYLALEDEPREVQRERIYTYGKDTRNDAKMGVYESDRVHTLIVGKPYTGKSTLMLNLMLQDIEKGDGVFLIDPHDDLARKFLTHIPEERWEDVIYINPETALDFGQVVKFNFIDPRAARNEKHAATIFMDSLAKLFGRFWGPRLKLILRNSLYALYEGKPQEANLEGLSKIVSDDEYRDDAVDKTRSAEVIRFWRKKYPKMPEESISSVHTKLGDLLQEGSIQEMIRTMRSDVDFRRLMDEQKIVIISLPKGLITGDVTNFLGSLFLSRIYLAALSRVDTPEEERKKVNVYVDEAHSFVGRELASNLQEVRKFKVFLTLASQSLEDFEHGYNYDLRESIPSLCDVLVAFQCGLSTAKRLEGAYPNDRIDRDALQTLPFYMFAMVAEVRGLRENQVLQTIDLKDGPNNPTKVISTSLEEHASSVVRRGPSGEYRPDVKLPYPTLTPVAFLTLTWLAKHGPTTDNNLTGKLHERHGFDSPSITQGINWCGQSGWISEEAKHVDAAGRKSRRKHRHLKLTRDGWEQLYPELKGVRAGKARHAIMLGKMARYCWQYTKCPIITTGERDDTEVNITYEGRQVKVVTTLHPDMIVYPPSRSGSRINPHRWYSPKVFAVEVETDPGRHPRRVLAHYENCSNWMEIPVAFAVPTPEDVEKMEELLGEAGANIVQTVIGEGEPGDVEIRVVRPELDSDEDLTRWFNDFMRTVRDSDKPDDYEPEDWIEERIENREKKRKRMGEELDELAEKRAEQAREPPTEKVADWKDEVLEGIRPSQPIEERAEEEELEEPKEEEELKEPEEEKEPEEPEEEELEEPEEDEPEEPREEEKLKKKVKEKPDVEEPVGINPERLEKIRRLKENGWNFSRTTSRNRVYLRARRWRPGKPTGYLETSFKRSLPRRTSSQIVSTWRKSSST